MTVTQSNIEDVTLDAPEQPQPATRTVERGPGRPGRKAVTDGQVDIFGVVIEVREPERKSRSVQAEPSPETFSETDDLAAVAQAAAEAFTTDVDAWLAEQDPNPDAHVFCKRWNRGVAAALSSESLSVYVAASRHALAWGPAEAHIWDMPKLAGGLLARETMIRATKKLVELGYLVKRYRGRLANGDTRPMEYRPGPQWIEASRSVIVSHPTDEPATQAPPLSDPESPKPLSDPESPDRDFLDSSTTTVPEQYEAAGAACVDCGGPVTTAPGGTANPRCKPCHVAWKSRSRGRPDLEQAPPPPVRGSGTGPDCNECGRDADTLTARGHARWCSSLDADQTEPKSAAQNAHRAPASISDGNQTIAQLNAARDALRASREIEG